MCLIVLAWNAHPRYRLVIAANRDEFHSRPTAPAAFWADAPNLLAGRDLRGGGTWLGVTRNGRFAALTNVRDPSRERPGAPSRGNLVREYLTGADAPTAYLRHVSERTAAFNGFNLLVGDRAALWWYSNHAAAPQPLMPGFHGVSNHLLNTPWPKVLRAKAGLADRLRGADHLRPEALFALLADAEPAADALLPDTSVGLQRERALSPVFISGAEYGTRSSTVLLVEHGGEALFVERTFGPAGDAVREVRFRLAPPNRTSAGTLVSAPLG